MSAAGAPGTCLGHLVSDSNVLIWDVLWGTFASYKNQHRAGLLKPVSSVGNAGARCRLVFAIRIRKNVSSPNDVLCLDPHDSETCPDDLKLGQGNLRARQGLLSAHTLQGRY